MVQSIFHLQKLDGLWSTAAVIHCCIMSLIIGIALIPHRTTDFWMGSLLAGIIMDIMFFFEAVMFWREFRISRK